MDNAIPNLTGVRYVIKWLCEINYYAINWIRKISVYYIIHGNDELGSSHCAEYVQYFFNFLDRLLMLFS